MTDDGAIYLPKWNEENMKEKLAKYGPISIYLYATDNFVSYHSGVFDDHLCKIELDVDSRVNRAMLLVGYGADHEHRVNYWIVKNSWTPSWGEEGYIRIKRGVNMCGIASYPVIAKI